MPVERLPCPRCGRKLNFTNDRIPQHYKEGTNDPCGRRSGREQRPKSKPEPSPEPKRESNVNHQLSGFRRANRNLTIKLRKVEAELTRYRMAGVKPLPVSWEEGCTIQVGQQIMKVPDIQY